MVDIFTVAVISVILIVIMVVIYIRYQLLGKSSPNKEVVSPSNRSGYPYLLDTIHFTAGGGEITGGKLLRKDIIKINLRTADGDVSQDYLLDDLVVFNKSTHLLGGGQPVWIYKSDKVNMITPVNDGDNIHDTFREQEELIKKQQKELDDLKAENEIVKANIDVYMSDRVSDTERLSKASKPLMKKSM